MDSIYTSMKQLKTEAPKELELVPMEAVKEYEPKKESHWVREGKEFGSLVAKK